MQIHISPKQWVVTEGSAKHVWTELMDAVQRRIEYIQMCEPIQRIPHDTYRLPTATERLYHRDLYEAWKQAERYSRIIIDPAGLQELYRGVPPGELSRDGMWDTIHCIRNNTLTHLFGQPFTATVVRADKGWEKRVTLL